MSRINLQNVCHIQHKMFMSMMNLQNVWYMNLNLQNVYYLNLHLFMLMSDMIFLCQGWIYKMIAIYNIALVYSYAQHDVFMSRMNLRNVCHIQHNISMSRINLRNVYFYVKDESTKWLLYGILHLFILMSDMIFSCQGWIYRVIIISCPESFS